MKKSDNVMKSKKLSTLTAIGPAIAGLLMFLGSAPAAADAVRIGLVAPLSGAFAPLGEQLKTGALVAAASANVDIIAVDDQCSAEGGKAAAEQLLQNNVQLITGFLCSDALEAALAVLAGKNIAIVTSGVSDFTLSERRAPGTHAVFRLATGMDKETRATANILGSLWRAEPFAIIDDGTIEGRERASRVLAGLKAQQLQPAFTDTYRPGLDNQNALVSRLKRAGANHVFVGGERDDVAAIGASAVTLKYGLTIAGSSQLTAAAGPVELQQGTLMIAPLPADTLASAQSAIEALHEGGHQAGSLSIIGYASLQIAAAAMKPTGDGNINPLEQLRNASFDTALGTIRFEANGLRNDNPNRLQRFNGHVFVPLND